MGNENSGKISFFDRISVLFRGRFPMKEATIESASVRALKKQNNILEDIIDQQSFMIKDMSKQISNHADVSTQDKMLDMVGQFFLGGKTITTPPNTFSTTHPQAENNSVTDQSSSKEDYSNEQLTAMISQYDSKAIKTALIMGDGFLSKKIREHFPQISDDSLKRGLAIAKTL